MVVNVEVPPLVHPRVIGDLSWCASHLISIRPCPARDRRRRSRLRSAPTRSGCTSRLGHLLAQDSWLLLLVVGVVAWRSQWSGITTGGAYHNSSRTSSSTM